MWPTKRERKRVCERDLKERSCGKERINYFKQDRGEYEDNVLRIQSVGRVKERKSPLNSTVLPLAFSAFVQLL